MVGMVGFCGSRVLPVSASEPVLIAGAGLRAGGGEDAPRVGEGAAPLVTEVLENRPYEDGYLQLELRRYVRRDGSARERGPYWYFQFHEHGKRKKLYLGKTTDPEGTLDAKRRGLAEK